ncbi:unnamed protein product [Leptosia nina]|uniref:Ribosomal protein L20 n=1 Tax=Leptosia nina TaxID=320188 RepID=A0AAV1JBM0_9NEOP
MASRSKAHKQLSCKQSLLLFRRQGGGRKQGSNANSRHLRNKLSCCCDTWKWLSKAKYIYLAYLLRRVY